MATVHIPDSMADAIKSLTGMAALLRAKEWERAAIVYAFTKPGEGQGERTDRHPTEFRQKLSIGDFAGSGIAGLKTRETVALYRSAWQSAIDDGQAQPVAPGDDIELPAIPWPPTAHVRGRIDMARASAPPEEKAQIIRQLIEEDPKAAEIVAADLPVMRRLDAARMDREPHHAQPAPTQPDFDAMVASATGRIHVALLAEKDGQWAPNPDSELFLHMLGQLLRNRRDDEPARIDSGDLFSEIQKHLAGVR